MSRQISLHTSLHSICLSITIECKEAWNSQRLNMGWSLFWIFHNAANFWWHYSLGQVFMGLSNLPKMMIMMMMMVVRNKQNHIICWIMTTTDGNCREKGASCKTFATVFCGCIWAIPFCFYFVRGKSLCLFLWHANFPVFRLRAFVLFAHFCSSFLLCGVRCLAFL